MGLFIGSTTSRNQLPSRSSMGCRRLLRTLGRPDHSGSRPRGRDPWGDKKPMIHSWKMVYITHACVQARPGRNHPQMAWFYWLVVWNMNFMTFHSVWKNHPNWRTHIVQRGRYTTNQILWMNHTQLSATVIFSSPWAAPGLGRRTPLWAPSLVGLWGTRWTHTGRRRCWVMLSADTTDTTEMRYIMV